MKRSLLALLVACLASLGSAKQTTLKIEPRTPNAPVEAGLTLVGSLENVSVEYRNGELVTVVSIMEFSKNQTPFGDNSQPSSSPHFSLRKEVKITLPPPVISTAVLCGDRKEIDPLYHTNVTLTYNPVSSRRQTGCFDVLQIGPWEISETVGNKKTGITKVNTVIWDKSKVHGSKDLEKIIRGIGNGSIK